MWYFNGYYDKTAMANQVATMYFRNEPATFYDSAFVLAQLQQFDSSNGARSGNQDTVVLLTDGAVSVDYQKATDAARTLRYSGVDIFVIGWGAVNRTLMVEFVGGQPYANRVYIADSYQYLLADFERAFDLVCYGGDYSAYPGYTSQPALPTAAPQQPVPSPYPSPSPTAAPNSVYTEGE